MTERVVISSTFRGPPDSGNGGYIAGVLAKLFADLVGPGNAAVEVTLRAPTPLDKELQVTVTPDTVELWDAQTLIAQALATSLEMTVPPAPAYSVAAQHTHKSPSFIPNVNPLLPQGTGFHPVCFCCGADVDKQQGLHVYAAPVEGFDGVAAAWRPPLSFADGQGNLPLEVIWAALDCPGQFAYYVDGIRTGLLGRMTGRLLKSVPAAQDLVVTGWCIEIERSKHFAGTALFDSQGELCGYSKQVWIGRRD